MYIKQSKIIINNEKYIVRLLKSKDEQMLVDFFLNLSDDVKKKYSPHSFDCKTAVEICKQEDKRYKRVICVYKGAIIGYCIMYFKLRKWENMRYDKAKMFMNNDDVCTIAPCVLADFQHRGIGSEMFRYVYNVAKLHNKKNIILWGGVVVKNHEAVNYYKKMNLKILNKWLHPLSRVMCYDMYLNIQEG